MTPDSFASIPPWVNQLTWSLITLLSAYLLGQFITRTVCRRLSAWASKTTWQWDDLVIAALRRGIPAWSLLAGLYVSTGFWPLPSHVLDVLTNILFVLTWLSMTLIGAGLASQLIVLYGSQFQQSLPMTSVTQNVTKILIIVLGLLMILHGLGVSIAPLLTALGVGGLAVALALQDTLSNVFSGLYITMSRHVRIGDYVRLESGEEGYVEDIGWRATKIRTPPNNMVLVPNNKLSQTIITNYYLPSRELAVVMGVNVDYRSDLEHVERVTREVGQEVMRTVPGAIPEFEPVIRYHSFGESGVQLAVVLRAKEFVAQDLIKHEFIKRLQARYKREGITIPFPSRTVYVTGSGEPATSSLKRG